MDPPPHLLRQADQREGGWGPSEGVRCRGKRRDSLSCQTGSSGEGGVRCWPGSKGGGFQRGQARPARPGSPRCVSARSPTLTPRLSDCRAARPRGTRHLLNKGLPTPAASAFGQERDPRSGAGAFAAGEGRAPGAARSCTFEAAPPGRCGGEAAHPAA